MEKNEGQGKLFPGGSYTELEKFKRRLIRAVARMLMYEKRNEDEVWEGLMKETGCDCKLLWRRLHALTVKKLDRLMQVEDHVNRLPKAARMSITDWLMFDTVLVHEEIDVIGMNERTTEDKPSLVNLFDLVEKHKIEFLAGDELADAWLKVTLEYNQDDRQCTPMLLQRRWYQLKLSTRAKFYKFWYAYRGSEKRKHLAEPFRPTKLQLKIAWRYKPLVVKTFVLWEELISNNLVILPEEFERKGNIQPRKSADVAPDVMCVEPVMEVIDLDSDTEVELEYRKTPQKDNPVIIAIKQEPIDTKVTELDETAHYENREEKILHFAEAVLEATAMELDEIELAEDIDGFLSTNPVGDKEVSLNECNDKNTTTDSVTEVPSHKGDKTVSEVNSDNLGIIAENQNSAPVTGNEIEIIQIESISETGVNDVQTFEDTNTENNDIEINRDNEPEPMLPQITSIFGGVDVSNETLSKISLLSAQITNSTNKTIIGNQSDLYVASTASIAVSSESSDDLNPVDNGSESNNIIKSDVIIQETSKTTWFGDLTNDIDFADDGIQLVDDGIAYSEDETACQIVETDTEDDMVEQEVLNEEKEDDVPKIDEKLLLLPVVNILKLDDMGILPIGLLRHIDSKSLIELITLKNSPLKNKLDSLKPIKREINTSPSPVNTELDPSLSTAKVTDEIKRVKISSTLLQKPRSRTYNTIQLCKNPDFNTRLKKLNVGFFSSALNRWLLRACKPLSIDVSKAFERKLVNGTMYLEMDNSGNLNKDTEPVENSQSVSVVPSAMVVQSLIDNLITRGYKPPVSCPIAPKSTEVSPPMSERNKVINLPDISEIRRINQKLLTAEVMPLQANGGVPVSLCSTENSSQNLHTKVAKVIAGPASKTKLMPPQVVDITKDDLNNGNNSQTKNMVVSKDNLKTTNKPWNNPWAPKHKTEIPWVSSINNVYAEDTLLALDSLNKMLYLLTDPSGSVPSGTKSAPISKSNKKKKIGRPRSKNHDNDDVQIVSESEVNNAEAKIHLNAQSATITEVGNTKIKKRLNEEIDSEGKVDNMEAKLPRIGQVVSGMKLANTENKKSRTDNTDHSDSGHKPRQLYCCWARERICRLIFSKKHVKVHNCPFPLCLCCCRTALLDFIKRQESATDPKQKNTLPPSRVASKTGTSTNESVTLVKENKVSDDVVEIIPFEKEPVNALSTEPNSEKKLVKVLATEPKSDKEPVTDLATESNSDKEIETSDIYDPETTIITATVVSPNDSTQDVVKQIPNEKSNITEIATEISVTTSNNPISDECRQNSATIDLEASINTNSIDNPRVRVKPRIRVKSAPKSKNAADASRPKKVTLEQRVLSQTSRQFILSQKSLENVRQSVIDHDLLPALTKTKPSIIREKNTCPVVPNILKKNTNQKMIYLNSKQISELPSDNPIYLGKDKILLTTAKFPPNFKAFETFQANIKQTLALPKGIKLILLPSGRLTYVRDRKIDVSDEFMASLPHLIAAIQQQINGNVLQPSPNKSQAEVIDLSDDETPDVVKNTEEQAEVEGSVDNMNGAKHSDISQTEDSIEASTSDIATKNLDQIKSIESASGYTQSVSKESESTVDTNGTSGKFSNILSDLMAMSGIEPTDITSTEKEAEIEAATVERVSEQIINCENRSLESIYQCSTDPQFLETTLKQNSSIHLAQMINNDPIISNTEPITNKVLTKSLTPITSLSELKYACTQHGLFFKLDLDTGLLMPINVCMKKFTDSNGREQHYGRKINVIQRESKPIIDLTDDDVSEVTELEQIPSNSLLKTNQLNQHSDVIEINNIPDTINSEEASSPLDLDESNYVISTRSVSVTSDRIIDPYIDGKNITKDGKVKPLKLFRSGGSNALQQKLKEIQKRILDVRLAQDLDRRKVKRKQELTWNSDKIVSSDDSSDEEPLAKKATKMRAAENIVMENTKSLDTIEADTDLPVNNAKTGQTDQLTHIEADPNINLQGEGEELPIQPLSETTLNENESNELRVEDEEMVIECLDETMLNEDETAEDCILGV